MTDINSFFNGSLEDQIKYLHENCPGHVCSDLLNLLWIWRQLRGHEENHPLFPKFSISPFGYVIYGNSILEHRFQWGFAGWKEIGKIFGRVDIVETLLSYVEGDLKLEGPGEKYLRTLQKYLKNEIYS